MLEFATVDASDGARLGQARTLFREYETELGEDLCFQDFEGELSELPGVYGPPHGSLLLAEISGVAIGCVALRPLNKGTCEMKRLYVRPSYRGSSFGRELAEEIVARARSKGYKLMRLDTLARLVPAVMLYRAMGFTECAPYYDNPIDGVVYMELDLSAT